MPWADIHLFFTFPRPSHEIWLSSNSEKVIRGSSCNAIAESVKELLFTSSIRQGFALAEAPVPDVKTSHELLDYSASLVIQHS